MSAAPGHARNRSIWDASNWSATLAPNDPVSLGLRSCARRMIGIAVFSGVVNVLMLSGSLYMLQVYDRVIPSRSVATLRAGCQSRNRIRLLPSISSTLLAVYRDAGATY